jgi:transposase
LTYGKKYDNEFKVMIVALLNSGIKTKQVSDDYGLSLSMIGRWKREYKLKSEDFLYFLSAILIVVFCP